MGGACSTYGGEERCIQGFCSGNLTEREHLENLCLDGRIILKCVFRKLGGGMDWIAVFQDGDKWRTLVNVVMNIRVP
jgi:hypothetical protein